MNTTAVRRWERRQLSRARVQLPARYSSANLTLDGQVSDVSPDGLFFAADFLDEVGESASIAMHVPSRPTPLQLKGQVCRVSDAAHGSGMGIRLIAVTLPDRLILAGLQDEALQASDPADRGNA